MIPTDFHIFQRGGSNTNQLFSGGTFLLRHPVACFPSVHSFPVLNNVCPSRSTKCSFVLMFQGQGLMVFCRESEIA